MTVNHSPKITMTTYRRKAVKIFQAITIRRLHFPRKIHWLGKSVSLGRTKSVVFEHVFGLFIFRCPLPMIFTTQICVGETSWLYSLMMIFWEWEIVYSSNNKWPFKHGGDEPCQTQSLKSNIFYNNGLLLVWEG